MSLYTKQEALDYHAVPKPGKLEILPSKPCRTQKDLSLAYSPGVADACLAIKAERSEVYKYTGKGNLVAVISNGTAVLGLGNIGPEAAKPVMEGKGVLFKLFADIDVFDLEVKAADADEFCRVVAALEPSFGGINLEDIKAPECFYIEKTLKEQMNIPVFHDDQHGTAIISSAGLLNALEISGKKIEDCRIVISGAGAAAIASARLYKTLGVDPERIAMFDSRGHINLERKDLSPEKKEFASSVAYASLAEAMKGADAFLGLSAPGMVSKEMAASMSPRCPILFACANPSPEIPYPEAKAARPDAIVATGRSDFPNQINNVLGFPYIFRGALDVRAKAVTEGMKIAAARAIAALAKEAVPVEVCDAFGVKELKFGLDYVIPKALDQRLTEWVAGAVAEAAVREGTATTLPLEDMQTYKKSLGPRLKASRARCEALLGADGA